MKQYFLLLLLTTCCSLANAVELISPTLTPKAVIKNTEKYLVKEKAIVLDKYDLTSISFNYYSSQDKTMGKWILHYTCKPINGIKTTDCGFTVSADNSKNPKFEFHPINV